MIIKKILNNNFLIVEENQAEKIIMGRGIAFNKKIGQKVDKNLIQKEFVTTNTEFENKLAYLINNVSMEIFQVVEEIVDLYKKEFGKELSDAVYFSLSDHLNFSLTRSQEEYTYKNMMIWDIHNFYPKEYEIGIYGRNRMNQLYDLELPKEEAGFITMHLLNADISTDNPSEIQQIIQIVQEVTDTIRYFFGIEFETQSIHYQRLVTHVRFFAQRVVKGVIESQGLDNEELLSMIKEKYLETYRCVLTIEKHIKKKYQFNLSAEEKMYLTLHIQKIVFEKEEEKENE